MSQQPYSLRLYGYYGSRARGILVRTEAATPTLPPVGGEGRPPSRKRRRTGWGDYACSVVVLGEKFFAPSKRRPPPPTPPRHSLRSRGEGSRRAQNPMTAFPCSQRSEEHTS